MRRILVPIGGALILVLGVACAGAASTPTPAPPTATPVPTATSTPKIEAKEAPAALKSAEEAMTKVKSFKVKGTMTMTPVGTPIPGMPTGPQSFTMEISDKNYRFVQGDTELIQVDNVVYIKAGKDQPWTKSPVSPDEAGGQDTPGQFVGKLKDPVNVGVEPCPRGGLCQVIVASLTETAGDKVTYKMWIGADGLVYKYEISETGPQGKTEGVFEAYDYNVPITLKSPIP